MLRTILAVVLGYVAIIVVVTLANFGLYTLFGLGPMTEQIDPSTLPMGYLVGSLVSGLLAAVVGGWITARVATHSPVRHGLYLAILLAVLGLVSLALTWGKQPLWFALLLPILGFAGARFGAGLRAGAAQAR